MYYFIIYSIKVSISMLLFLLVWKTFLKKEKIFTLQRFFLISSLVLSFIFPLLNFEIQTIQNGIVQEYTKTISLDEVVINSKSSQTLFYIFLYYTYFFISSLLLIRFIFRIISVLTFASKCEVSYYNNTRIYLTDRTISPFSFMNYIFFNKNEIKKANFSQILKHEIIHKRDKHSFDIILIELIAIFQWFNPLIYLFRKEVKTLHEYLSDEKVILQGFKTDEYKMLLINRQIGKEFKFANYFNQSLTLKRIKMLDKIKSKRGAKYKVLWALPIIAIMLFSFSFSPKQNNENISSNQNLQDTVYDKVDKMPVFKGGNHALRVFLATNIKYPEYSKKNKEQGTVYLKFVVTKDKKVDKVEITRGVTENLDTEALRVIKMLPDFEKPGYKNGNAVNVYYSIPVSFKLQ